MQEDSQVFERRSLEENFNKLSQAGTDLADTVLAYFDSHPKGSVSFVDRLTGSDGRQILILPSDTSPSVSFKPVELGD